ncbi:sensor histidine kinase [Brevibacterium sp. FAM 25378]|uniref:sensor histidine kinase n=1 Tax=unclassified Brevibacterium TaxID=2614124 RepID=UPI0010932B70|nr:histidine kinase [Brevibacterium sp. S22]TGD29683.1 two-component sensor histidine kinase [Brevibacterium sp. S22]
MTPRPARRPLAHALLWTGISAVVGALILFVVIGNQWPNPKPTGAEADALSAEIFVHIAFGLVAFVCLPIVLLFDGRRVPRKQLRPKVLAAEKLREFLTVTGHGGEEYLAADGSVESLQRRPGGWIPVTVGIIGILIGTVSTLGAIAASIMLVSLSARRSWALDFGALAATLASFSATYILTPQAAGAFDLPVFVFGGTMYAVLVIIGVIRGSREQGIIDSAAQTLLRERSRQDRAIAEVRRGIARDMHDSLSHHLSVIAMYSGALSVRQDLAPDEVRESARLIADAARRSGVELREVLTMLRSDDQGTVIDPDIDRLVAARGDTAELRYLEPVLHRCGALEQTTIYRFVQEAITNAVKHAPGQKVTIKVGFDEADGHLELVASNPHTGLAPAFRAGAQQLVTGSGLGLLGLRERMEAMGGDLTVTTTPEFTLRARIPIDSAVLTDDDSEGAAGTAGSPDDQERP